MAYRQKYTPNVKISAQRGWCLKYIDDAGNAPKRTANARAALNVEIRAKRLSKATPPVNVWVVGFLDLRSGYAANLDHVFFMKYLGNGKYEIRDSETQAKARAVYTSISQIVAWFGNYNPVYVGWSTHCDGRQYAEKYTPKPTTQLIRKHGTATVIVDTLNVRSGPSTSDKVVARYKRGEKFNYDSYIKKNGYTWLSYISWSGRRRYIAQASTDGKTKYVKGGV